MNTSLPVRFDYSVTINYLDGTTPSEFTDVFPDEGGLIDCTFSKINGYDANGNRVTNLVGYNGGNLLKRCPSCNLDKPTMQYGPSGRVTTGQRDQSQCSDCRGSY